MAEFFSGRQYGVIIYNSARLLKKYTTCRCQATHAVKAIWCVAATDEKRWLKLRHIYC